MRPTPRKQAMTSDAQANFTPQELVWARAQLTIRAHEKWEIEAGRIDFATVRKRRCYRARQAGVSRARHRELIRHVQQEAP